MKKQKYNPAVSAETEEFVKKYGISPEIAREASSLLPGANSVSGVDAIAAFLSRLSETETAGVLAYVKDQADERVAQNAEMDRVFRELCAKYGVDPDAIRAESSKGKIGFPPEFIEKHNVTVKKHVKAIIGE